MASIKHIKKHFRCNSKFQQIHFTPTSTLCQQQASLCPSVYPLYGLSIWNLLVDTSHWSPLWEYTEDERLTFGKYSKREKKLTKNMEKIYWCLEYLRLLLLFEISQMKIDEYVRMHKIAYVIYRGWFNKFKEM